MNILIICRYLSLGGAERVAVSWANGLHRLGNVVYILSDTSVPQTYHLDPHIQLISLPTGFYRSVGIWNNILNRLIYIKQVKSIIDTKSIDVIIKVMHVNAIDLLFSRMLSHRKPPIIMTDHNAYERPTSAPMSIKLKFQKFWLNRLFDRVTVLTKRDMDIATHHHLHNVKVLYNPLCLEPVYEVDTKNRKNIILAVGRLDSWHVKGFDNLILAWNLICDKYPDWKLRIVGNGSESSIRYLESICTNPIKVEFVGFNEDIAKEYRQAKIFVLSSRYEGWGLVLVEAMSQGCACIACDYRGRQTEIIENYETGLICPPDDINALSKAIEVLINDKKLRLQLQKNAPNHTRRYTEDKVANNLLNIIKESIK